MAKTRFPIKDIQGLTPAVDQRNDARVYVVDGKNFVFDSKGPKSGFGSRLIAAGQVIETVGGIAQSISFGRNCFVFTSYGIYYRQTTIDGGEWTGEQWVQLLDLVTTYGIRIDSWRKKWTHAYLAGGIYFCHPDYGFFKYDFAGIVQKTSDDILGLPDKPLAICETNGRLVVLNRHYVTYSAPSLPEKFIPELGGAGFQKLSDRVPGKAHSISGFEQGFLVWTDEGVLTAEYIGGDTVFRYDRMTTDQIPLNTWAIENLPDGSQLICTRHGIHRTDNGREPEDIVPVFNEFFRHAIQHESWLHVRLTYNIDDNQLFVQLRDYTNHYVRTYVLSIALDKWGSFDERHLGIIKHSAGRGHWGYLDDKGRAHRFVEFAANRETSAGVYTGLDSFIELGDIRPPEMLESVDVIYEMQELLLGGLPIRPSDVEANKTLDDEGTLEYDIGNITGDVAVYISLDYSGSMGYDVPTRISQANAAIQGTLNTIKDLIVNDGLVIDIAGTRFSTISTNSPWYVNATAADIDSLITFFSAVAPVGGTDFVAAINPAVSFFTDSLNRTRSKRTFILVTDGVPDVIPNFPNAVTAAADMLDQSSGVFNTTDGTEVDMYGFNIYLADIQYTVQLDNTPIDSVPVILDGDPATLQAAIIAGISYGVIPPTVTVDDNGLTGLASIESQEDLHDEHAMLNPYDYDISVAFDIDGIYDANIAIPVKGIERSGSILWVLMTAGLHHRLRLEANTDGQFYHVRLAEATMVYRGQES